MQDYKMFRYISYLNQVFPGKAEILEAAEFIKSQGFVFADIRPVQPANREAYSLGYYVTAEAVIDRMYREQGLPDPSSPLEDQLGPISAGFYAYLPVYTPGPTPDQDVMHFNQNPRFAIYYEMKGATYNEIEFISGMHAHQVELKRILLPTLLQIAKAYYQRYQPAYAWFNSDPPAIDRLAFEPILEYQFRELYWMNFFGPEYVAKYGRDFFLNAPVWKTEELEDGGVLLQLSPDLLSTMTIDVRAIVRYFYPVGVRYLVWPDLIHFIDPDHWAETPKDLY